MTAKIYHAELWGLREAKYKTLSEKDIATTKWKELKPSSPYYFFVPRKEEFREEYEKGWKISDIFPVNSTGIVTARDHFVIDFERKPIEDRIKKFLDKESDDKAIKEQLNLSENYAWRVSEARKQLMSVKDWRNYFAKILYRPFDIRDIYFHPSVVWRTRKNVMRHMLAGENLGLIYMRQVALQEDYSHFGASRMPVDNRAFYSNKGIMSFAPLYLYPDEESAQGDLLIETGRKPNLNPKFVEELGEKLKIPLSPPLLKGELPPLHLPLTKGENKEEVTPEEIFYYIYAIFHSPTYRKRYAEFLKIDFPRVPLTSDKKLFQALSKKGEELVSLHLLESPKVKEFITKFNVSGSNEVEKVFYEFPSKKRGVPQGTGCVFINKTQHFEGVPKEVREFQVGGYQVCEKWLKDRKGRKLSTDEIEHYQKIVVALSETLYLMKEIDAINPDFSLP